MNTLWAFLVANRTRVVSVMIIFWLLIPWIVTLSDNLPLKFVAVFSLEIEVLNETSVMLS